MVQNSDVTLKDFVKSSSPDFEVILSDSSRFSARSSTICMVRVWSGKEDAILLFRQTFNNCYDVYGEAL
jgi:hypothetical protein